MGRLRVVYDRYGGAGDLFERALTAVERVGDELGIALALENLAMAQLTADDLVAARLTIDRVFEHRRSAGITYAGDDALDVLARVEHAEGHDEKAVTLLAAADVLRRQLHTPLWPPALERHERLLAELQRASAIRSSTLHTREGRRSTWPMCTSSCRKARPCPKGPPTDEYAAAGGSPPAA